MSGSLTGLENQHRAFDLPQGPILHTMTPHYYWHAQPGIDEREFSRSCAKKLEGVIQLEGAHTIAAFIGEPVMGTGGIIPPPEGYWDEIQQGVEGAAAGVGYIRAVRTWVHVLRASGLSGGGACESGHPRAGEAEFRAS